MIRTLLVAALLGVVCSSANARPRHGHQVQAIDLPFFGLFEAPQAVSRQPAGRYRDAYRTHRRVPEGLARVMAEGAGRVATPARFIRGRLVCAVNIGAALAARGIRGTGSRLAKSYLRWGRASGPVPGAVAVFVRPGGGHVALVDHVQPDGTVIYLNPSSRRQAWQVGPYSRKPIAYRVAGGEW
jgi:hypothetical protein